MPAPSPGKHRCNNSSSELSITFRSGARQGSLLDVLAPCFGHMMLPSHNPSVPVDCCRRGTNLQVRRVEGVLQPHGVEAAPVAGRPQGRLQRRSQLALQRRPGRREQPPGSSLQLQMCIETGEGSPARIQVWVESWSISTRQHYTQQQRRHLVLQAPSALYSTYGNLQ